MHAECAGKKRRKTRITPEAEQSISGANQQVSPELPGREVARDSRAPTVVKIWRLIVLHLTRSKLTRNITGLPQASPFSRSRFAGTA